MAKKVDDDTAETNTFDPKRVETIVRKIEDEHEGLLSERMSYMAKCKPYRERIAMAYEEGIRFDIKKKVLKAKIRERALRRQIDGIADDFEVDDRDAFEQVSQALGDYADLPLGKAAVNAAEKKGRGRKSSPPDAVSAADGPDLRSNAQKLAERGREEEADRVAAENRSKLEGGISQLN